MPHYDYLLIGGGMAADSAAKAIRTLDKSGSIGILCSESHEPYRRPTLSKQLWNGVPLERVWLNTASTGAVMVKGRSATAIDPGKHEVTDDSGDTCSYNKLLIATGVSPRKLPFGDDNVIYYRTLNDYHRLRAQADAGEDFVILGGGFTGTELAAELAGIGKKVTMIFPEDQIGARVFPFDLTCFLSDYYRENRVEIIAGDLPVSVEKYGGRYVVRTKAGREIAADGVVASIGAVPEDSLATEAGLETDNGIRVNEFLQTSDPDIYSAGDVANFYSEALEKRKRSEHADNAVNSGRCAGRAMAGRPEPYNHIAFAYAGMFDMGYRAVGEIDSRLEMVAEWKVQCKEGVVYYLSDGRVRGVLFWNMKQDIDSAREVLTRKKPIPNEELRRLFGG